jgi:hypothetical protein
VLAEGIPANAAPASVRLIITAVTTNRTLMFSTSVSSLPKSKIPCLLTHPLPLT